MASRKVLYIPRSESLASVHVTLAHRSVQEGWHGHLISGKGAAQSDADQSLADACEPIKDCCCIASAPNNQSVQLQSDLASAATGGSVLEVGTCVCAPHSECWMRQANGGGARIISIVGC